MRLLVVASLVGVCACTLLTSLDDYAGTPPSDAGVTGSDASVDGATGVPWCMTNAPDADFCADFETKDLSQFDKVEQTKGTVTRDPDAKEASSTPYSVRCDVPADLVDGGTGAVACIVHGTGSAVSDVELALDFRLDKLPAGGRSAAIAKLIQRGGGAPWEIGIKLAPDGRKPTIYTYDNDAANSNAYAEPFTSDNPIVVGQWVRFALHFRATGRLEGNFDFDIDGQRVASAVAVFPGYAQAPTQAFAGVSYVPTPHDAWAVRIDNFVFDAK